jgi:A/G-specific adenine glycosylase
LALDPYAVLVSELMLQQTQVATVIPYFQRWMQRLPTVAALAAASESEVLKLWEGLGYYSRARNLHRAAKFVVAHHTGNLPADRDALLELPGVGPYTAGAVASIAFDQPEPIVDGNVQRVLTRLFAYRGDPRSKEGQGWLWETAGSLVPKVRPGDFNSALMELGATVCTPRNPQCNTCPLAKRCAAKSNNLQTEIPPAKPTKPTPHHTRTIHLFRKSNQTYLLEQRPAKGRWANLWQFPTREAPLHPGRRLGQISHALTHRKYTFDVVLVEVPNTFAMETAGASNWLTLEQIADFALPRPQLAALAMLRDAESGLFA